MTKLVISDNENPPWHDFPEIDEWIIDSHIKMQKISMQGGNTLSWIHDVRAHAYSLLVNPVSWILEKISRESKTGEIFFDSIHSYAKLRSIILKYPHHWKGILYNIWNKKWILQYIWESFLQNREPKNKYDSHNRQGFDPGYMQILFSIQEFYQKLPD